MELINYENFLSLNIDKRLVCALGQFDGVHRGHVELLKKLNFLKTKDDITAVILFNPDPMFVLNFDASLELTTLDEKLLLMEPFNIDYLIVIPFTKEFARLSPKSFIEDFLLKMKVRLAVVGFDYSFGYLGKGKASDIAVLSNNLIDVIILDKIIYQQEKISSSIIRNKIISGDIEMANEFLGYHYILTGEVVKGRGVGKKINLPTINIAVKKNISQMIKGVYAVKVVVNKQKYLGMMNIGHNPSFNYNDKLSVEVNIFDFTEEIYGQKIIIEVYKFIRNEEKFTSVDAFLQQISKDKRKIINFFSK